MVYVHTILRDVAGLFKVGRLVAYAHGRDRRINLRLLLKIGEICTIIWLLPKSTEKISG